MLDQDWTNPTPPGYCRPFLAIRVPIIPVPKATLYPTSNDVIKALKGFDFAKANEASIAGLTNVLAKYYIQGHEPIPLGRFGLIDYSISIEPLGDRSLNPQGHVKYRSDYTLELFKNLYFSKDRDYVNTEFTGFSHAFALGRLKATHHHEEKFLQSHWVIMLDESHLLWALFANDIDLEDECAAGRYCYNSDTAFGVRRDKGEKVILLGHIKQLAFRENFKLKGTIQVRAMEWSTTTTDYLHLPSIRRLVSPTYISGLLRTCLDALELPELSARVANNVAYSNLHDLRSKLGYLCFCADFQRLNDKVSINRKLMEAAWAKVVFEAYKDMDTKDKEREEPKFMTNLEDLSHCLFQVNVSQTISEC